MSVRRHHDNDDSADGDENAHKRRRVSSQLLTPEELDALCAFPPLARLALLGRLSRFLSGHASAYKVGSIVRVTLKDFVTYDHVTFRPGPHLNVVIGPNGTGKSTLVCALVLGLGEGPIYLGRQRDPVAYIKHGKDVAVIEIELKGQGAKNTVIQRTIKKASRTSTWRINNKVASNEDVRKRVESLNIQVNNLVQVLPQERVSDFAALLPPDLLKRTEEAIGGSNLRKWHAELIELKDKQREEMRGVAGKEQLLADLQQQIATMETDLARFKEREELQEKLEQLNKKRPWLDFEETRQLAVEKKSTFKTARHELNEAEKSLAPMRRRIEETNRAAAAKEDEMDKQTSELRKMDTTRKALVNKNDALAMQMTNLETEISNVKGRVEMRLKKVEELRRNIAIRQEKLDASESKHDVDHRIKELDKEISELAKVVRDVDNARLDIDRERREVESNKQRVEREMHSLTDHTRQRLAMIRDKSSGTFEAYQWLQRNQRLFQKPVLGPVALALEAGEPLYARYLEQALGEHLMAFIPQTREDRATFLDRCPAHGLRLKRFGIVGYLDQLFEAPDAVKRTLCQVASIHAQAAGSAQTNQHIESVLALRVPTVYTPEYVYSQKHSRYGGGSSTSVQPLKPGRVLGASGSADQLERLQAELSRWNSELARLNAEWQSKSAEDARRSLQAKRTEKASLTNIDKHRSVLQTQIASYQRQLDAEMGHEDNVEEEEVRLRGDMKRILLKRYENSKKLLESWTNITRTVLAQDSAYVLKLQLRYKVGELERELTRCTESFGELQRKVRTLANETSELKDQAKRKLSFAQDKCPLTNEIKELFKALPNSLQEIDEAVEDMNVKMGRIFVHNEHVLEDYDRKKKEIERLEAELHELHDFQATANDKIARLHYQWLPELEKAVATIATKFRNYMAKITCVGDVNILRDEHDYDKWGIDIRVNFRGNEGELQRLDAHVQSGGERSVATMLYLISLQDLTDCPFRLVDEINQGMDPINERMIFEQIVAAACRPGVPQYFLITPKLLTGLEYGQDTTVLCIFNGPRQPSEWSLPPAEFKRQLSQVTPAPSQLSMLTQS